MRRWFFLTCLLLVGCTSAPVTPVAQVGGALPVDGPVSVRWDSPATYRERSCAFSPAERNHEWVETLARHTRTQAAKRLQAGQTLDVHFIDIDRAGECEPRFDGRNDIRIVRSIYPPRIELHYVLRGANGQVREDTAIISDLGFQLGPTSLADTDTLRYEKRSIDAWLRRLLK